ncbi:MAG: hypothetical protein ACP5M7_04475, partial [Thermoproteota archaeon]
MSNKGYLKVAATAITLALLIASIFAIFPVVLKAAVPTTYTTTILNLANQTALTGLPSSAGVRVYLWNMSSNPPEIITSADVGSDGSVTFTGLPTYVWNTTKYAISANLTWGGTDKGVLLLDKTIIYDGSSTYPKTGTAPLATLLSTYSSYTPHNTYRVKTATSDYAYVQLSPFAFQVLDQAGYPATGASVQALLNLTYPDGTKEVLDFGAKFVNGTFGSEFNGGLPAPGAMPSPNMQVGWVEFVLPAPEKTSPASTFTNVTLLVRYKAKDPTNGPVVGRYAITGFTTYPPSSLPITMYQTVTTPIDATPGDTSGSLVLVSKNTIKTTISWVNIEFEDIKGNLWPTHKAEIAFKWYENPNGAYQYPGTTYDYGYAYARIPNTLAHMSTSNNLAAFNFTLTYVVTWFFSTVGGADRVKPSTIVSSGTYPVTTKMVMLSGIRMASSAETPQPLRNDVSLNIYLPSTEAFYGGIKANLSWVTDNVGYVVSPDPFPSTLFPSAPTAIWLPSSDIGQINFQAWFQNVKVLDTGVQGVVPAGAKPLNLTSADYGTQKNYSLAIYELGFVLNFYDGQKLTTVPSNVPFFFNHPGLGLI